MNPTYAWIECGGMSLRGIGKRMKKYLMKIM